MSDGPPVPPKKYLRPGIRVLIEVTPTPSGTKAISPVKDWLDAEHRRLGGSGVRCTYTDAEMLDGKPTGRLEAIFEAEDEDDDPTLLHTLHAALNAISVVKYSECVGPS